MTVFFYDERNDFSLNEPASLEIFPYIEENLPEFFTSGGNASSSATWSLTQLNPESTVFSEAVPGDGTKSIAFLSPGDYQFALTGLAEVTGNGFAEAVADQALRFEPSAIPEPAHSGLFAAASAVGMVLTLTFFRRRQPRGRAES